MIANATVDSLQVVEKVKHLIDVGNGDAGRLQHICDTIENNKSLYHSDQVYLKSKLTLSTNKSDAKQVTPSKQIKK